MCHLEHFVQVCTKTLWVCEEKLTTRKRTSSLEICEVERHITRSLLSVNEQVKELSDEINGNSSSERNNMCSFNIMDRQCNFVLLSFSVSSNIIFKRVY
jgi:hypothetical protein